ncbi:MAG: glycolate oxidase FAD binding subunit [Gammaproteobacteria bacterium]|nr:MAG: glycolate oxidase FAD binding subunit [Gammaproteobacteria bacterium]TND05027.1 MAG: glycolate oxidase FAD binding subunit [Gammaproteobacteria bacterium]
MNADKSNELRDTVLEAANAKTPLRIQGSGSKDFIGQAPSGERLSLREHRGIVNYQPNELVLTARAGTRLADIESQIAQHRQMLPFEPPHFGPDATLGGTIACGLSGPRRPYAGSARDFVLGVRMINGKGEILRFGGEVMKNVAGFDASRLMVGAMGTLGVLLDISMKVLPRPETEATLVFELGAAAAIDRMTQWSGKPLPISAACHDGQRLHLRLSGAASGVNAARQRLGGETLNSADAFWRSVRELSHPFFDDDAPLWRYSLPPATAALTFSKHWFIDWGGAQRWVKTVLPANIVRETAARAGGHATLFYSVRRESTFFHPLTPAALTLHKRLKAAFDPHGILNPGRLYRDIG